LQNSAVPPSADPWRADPRGIANVNGILP